MVKTGDAIAGRFITISPTTGAATDADSGPTATLVIDGDADGASVTVSDVGTGIYKWSVTLPALTAGQIVQVQASATVGGVAATAVVFTADADTTYQSETYASVATGNASAATAATQATTAATNTGTILTNLATVAGYIDTEIQTIITNIAALPAAVWDRATSALVAAGSIGAWILANAGSGASPQTFWEYAYRTLTQGASSVVAAVTGSSVTVYRGTLWTITLTGLTDFTGYTGLYFGVKGNPGEDTDTASICLVKMTTGLIAFAGDATITAGHAAIVVNSSTSITITVEADATQYATPGQYSYGVKALNASGKPFMVSSGGTFNIVADEVMAIS